MDNSLQRGGYVYWIYMYVYVFQSLYYWCAPHLFPYNCKTKQNWDTKCADVCRSAVMAGGGGTAGVDLSRKFVSEAELDERRKKRQEEWEKVRKPDDPEGKNRILLHTYPNLELVLLPIFITDSCLYYLDWELSPKIWQIAIAVLTRFSNSGNVFQFRIRIYIIENCRSSRATTQMYRSSCVHAPQMPQRRSMTHVPSLSGYRSRKTRNRKNSRSSSNSVSLFLFVVADIRLSFLSISKVWISRFILLFYQDKEPMVV